VVDVKRETRGAGRKLIEGGAELLTPGLPSEASPTPPKRRTVKVRVPVWFVDVRHAAGAYRVTGDSRRCNLTKIHRYQIAAVAA
jgi:hypothetical protein